MPIHPLAGFIPWPEARQQQYINMGVWENRCITDMLRDRAAQYPEKIALIDAPRQLSYAQLQSRIDTLACALFQHGIGAQQRVLLQLPNSMEYVIVYLALVHIGAIPVMALPSHRHSEVRHFLQASQAVVWIVVDTYRDFDYRPMMREMTQKCPHLKTILVLGEPEKGQAQQQALDVLLKEPLLQEHAEILKKVKTDPNTVATMLLSGGTTSVSKLIPRTHNDYVLNARLCGAAAGFDNHTVFMALLPLGHNYNLASPGMLGTLYYGGTVLIGQGMDAAAVFAQVAQYRVTVIAAVLPLIAQWLQTPLPANLDISSLKVIQNGGARLPPELRQRIRGQWGCTPQEIYGTAEGLINMTRLDDAEEILLHSSGQPVSELDEIKIIDDEGNELPDGEVGELVTRGPYTIQGYYDAPEHNTAAFTADGFYRMGDLCRKRGRVIYAEGRKKDLINRGGEKISCEEVENLIFKHPAVAQVALVAMPDAVFGEKACAFVELKPDMQLTHAELVAFLRDQRIASFKLPERLEVVERIPTSAVGKIVKRQLREMVVEKINAERNT